MKLTWSQLRVCRRYLFPYRVRTYKTGVEYPQITVPQRMIEKLAKKKTKQAIVAAGKKKINYKSPLIIAGKRKEYNHHRGQPFSEFDVAKLSSHGWKHAKSKGDYFTIMKHKGNPALQDDSGDVVEFDEMGLDGRILNVLKDQGISMPTKIQSEVIPVMLQGHNVICAAETGSGKTYAYLLPILHNILKDQSSSEIDNSEVRNSPRAIITAPSHELIAQLEPILVRFLADMSKSPTISPWIENSVRLDQLASEDPHFFIKYGVLQVFKEEFSISVVSVGDRERREINQPVDILLAPPGTLMSMLYRRRIKAKRLSSFILDEADTLLDDSFSGVIRKIVNKLQIGTNQPIEHPEYRSGGVQVGLASATYPKGLDTLLEPVLSFEDFEVVTTGSLHHVMPHVPQKFLRVGSSDKFMECAGLLKKYKGKPTLVFCNKSETCYWLSNSLKALGVENLLLTGYDEYKTRGEHLQSFYEGECDVLVCTDIASRGLDTQCVHHVINFDFPLFMSDYIHRAGRVGRVGSKHMGHVTSLVTYAWDVDLLWKIEIAARKQKELHNVNANIKRKIDSVVLEKYGIDDDETDSRGLP